MKKERWYMASCGTLGRYGMSAPIERKRALKLLKRSKGYTRMTGQRRYWLNFCPVEVNYAYKHGADPCFELVIGL